MPYPSAEFDGQMPHPKNICSNFGYTLFGWGRGGGMLKVGINYPLMHLMGDKQVTMVTLLFSPGVSQNVFQI